jgi:hypothetical protein
MRLHVIYRSYGGENDKGRPPYHDKTRNLASLLRAAAAAPGVDVTFIDNGPIPPERVALMEASGGRIVDIDVPTMRQSYRFALRYAMDAGWDAEDVVYLLEDDYLHLPGALAALEAASHAMPEVSYFLTYGGTEDYPTYRGAVPPYPVHWRPGISTVVDGQRWRPSLSATSTYAVRVGALREDWSIILQSHLPYRHHYLDHETGLVWQGYRPYRWGDIAREAVGGADGDLTTRLRAVAQAPFKVAFNLRAHRRADRRRLLYVAEPNLATHLESALLAPGPDWAAVAADVDAWLGDDPTAAVAGSARAVVVDGPQTAPPTPSQSSPEASRA